MVKIKDKKAFEAYREKLKRISDYTGVSPWETDATKNARIDKARKDVGYFVLTYLPHYASAESAGFQSRLAKEVKGHNNGQWLVRWGRGLAKSVWCDLVIPLWLWINGEDIYMVLVGNNYDKAQILLSDLQAEFEANKLLINDYGEQVSYGDWSEGYFVTKDQQFIGKALGMGQSPRGLRMKDKRPNMVVCDDLEDKDTIKNPRRQDEVVTWIEQDLIPTMDDKGRRYLHPNNNFAPRTIQGELENKHPGWKLRRVDAYDPVTYQPAWPEKYGDKHYKYIEEEIGHLAAMAEYNNTPHVEGKVFKDEWIQWAEVPRIDHYHHLVAYWDVAYSNANTADYNAIKIWGLKDANFYLLKAFVRQCKMYEAIEWMFLYNMQLPKGVHINWYYESQFWNDALQMVYDEVVKKYRRHIPLIKDERKKPKKYDRITGLVPYYQQGRVYYNKKEKGSNDMQTGLAQLKGIEPGYKTHDDSPDADEGAIYLLNQHITSQAPITIGGQRRNAKYY